MLLHIDRPVNTEKSWRLIANWQTGEHREELKACCILTDRWTQRRVEGFLHIDRPVNTEKSWRLSALTDRRTQGRRLLLIDIQANVVKTFITYWQTGERSEDVYYLLADRRTQWRRLLLIDKQANAVKTFITYWQTGELSEDVYYLLTDRRTQWRPEQSWV